MANLKELTGKELKDAAIKAALKFFNMKEYEILETKWSNGKDDIDIIAKDGNTIVFADVCINIDSSSFPEELIDKETINRFDRLITSYFFEKGFSDFDEMKIRYDWLGLACMYDSHAIIKHHINALLPA